MKKKIQTNFFCRSNHWPKRMRKITTLVKKIIKVKELGFKNKKYYFLNMIFVDDNEIKNLNNIYRKKNKITDVLTFINYVKNNKNIYEAHCDIFFSAETIKKDAKKNFIDFYDHITHLIIHCFLHINGYDHKKNSDFIKMKKLEEKILMKFNIKSPYIL